MTTENIRIALNARNDRSYWQRAVTADALDLLESYESRRDWEGREAETVEEFKSWILNGAKNWHEYSWAGCAYCYDGDIAAHYCTPSELKKTRNGNRRPNSREEWLDVQARALSQACSRLVSLFRREA